MRKWKDITLYQYQRVEEIKKSKDLSEEDKILFIACILFNKTEYELDKTKPKKVLKMISLIDKIFTSQFDAKPKKRIGKYFINYEISKITFGQYIELSFFLQEKEIIQASHYVLSSLSNLFLRKNNSKDHRKKSNYFLSRSITKVAGSLSLIIERFKSFNDEYKTLFGISEEIKSELPKTDNVSKFNTRYGWIYSAEEIAKYEIISLEEAYAMPIRRALNDLAYLKAKRNYEHELLKRK